MQNFDKGCAIFQRSGKHVASSALKDLKKVVSNLIQQRAMTELRCLEENTVVILKCSPV